MKKMVIWIIVLVTFSIGSFLGYMIQRQSIGHDALQAILLRHVFLRERVDGGHFKLSYECADMPRFAVDVDTAEKITFPPPSGSGSLEHTVERMYSEGKLVLLGASGYGVYSLGKSEAQIVKSIKAASDEERGKAVKYTITTIISTATGFVVGYLFGELNEPACDDSNIISAFEDKTDETWLTVTKDVRTNIVWNIVYKPAAPGGVGVPDELHPEDLQKLKEFEEKLKTHPELLDKVKRQVIEDSFQHPPATAAAKAKMERDAAIDKLDHMVDQNHVSSEFIQLALKISGRDDVNDLIVRDDRKAILNLLAPLSMALIVFALVMAGLLYLGMSASSWIAGLVAARRNGRPRTRA